MGHPAFEVRDRVLGGPFFSFRLMGGPFSSWVAPSRPLLADGAVGFAKLTVARSVWWALGTRAGGEVISASD